MSLKAGRSFIRTGFPASIFNLQPDRVHTSSRDFHFPRAESQKQYSSNFHNLLHRQVTSLLLADPKEAEDSQELTQERRQTCNRIKFSMYRDLKPKFRAYKSLKLLPSSMNSGHRRIRRTITFINETNNVDGVWL